MTDKALEKVLVFPKIEELNEPTLIHELSKSIKYLTNDKASGSDNIPLRSSNRQKKLSQDMQDAKIITLHTNKGERSNCNNYRGIFLLSIVGKFYARVILKKTTTSCRARIHRGALQLLNRQVDHRHAVLGVAAIREMPQADKNYLHLDMSAGTASSYSSR